MRHERPHRVWPSRAALFFFMLTSTHGTAQTLSPPALASPTGASPTLEPSAHAPSAPATEAGRLIRQLSAADWKTRQAAQDRLVMLDSAAIIPLQKAFLETDDAETRARAGAALADIAENRLVGPSIISMRFVDAPIDAIVAELSVQCGRKLEWDANSAPGSLGGRTFSIDIDRQPFWAAVRGFTERTGVTLRPAGGESKCAWEPGMFDRAKTGASTSVSGPFAVGVERPRRPAFADAGETVGLGRAFELAFVATAEPKMRVLSAGTRAIIDEAFDERGNRLSHTPDAPDASLSALSTVSTNATWRFNASLAYPAEAGNRIELLRGRVPVVVEIDGETLDLAGPGSDPSRVHCLAGMRLQFGTIRRSGAGYEMPMTLVRAGSAREDWDAIHRRIHNDLRLLDSAGRPLLQAKTAGDMSGDRLNLTVHYRPAPDAPAGLGRPVRLLWRVATRTRELTIPFEFRGLPMP